MLNYLWIQLSAYFSTSHHWTHSTLSNYREGHRLWRGFPGGKKKKASEKPPMTSDHSEYPSALPENKNTGADRCPWFCSVQSFHCWDLGPHRNILESKFTQMQPFTQFVFCCSSSFLIRSSSKIYWPKCLPDIFHSSYMREKPLFA